MRGKLTNRIPELANTFVKPRYPDITGQFRVDGTWGHVQLAGVARWITFDNSLGIDGRPSGTVFGWGGNLSGHLNTFGQDAIRGQIAYGRGIAAYSNDCCFDLAPDPIRAAALPLLNWLAYYDHWWSSDGVVPLVSAKISKITSSPSSTQNSIKEPTRR